jgi:aspartate/methionine/tyrosine aminotransferase
MFSKRTDWKLTPNRFTEAHREFTASGRKALDLTVSNPTRAGLAYDAKAILNSLSHPEALDYDPQSKGLLSARQAVARYYNEQPDTAGLSRTGTSEIHPESIVLTTSTSEAYSYVFRLLCDFEDEVLVPKPSYPLFDFLADLQDVKLVGYPLLYDHGWQIDFPSLHEAMTSRTRAVVVVHPNNPTGSFVSEAERQELNDFCRKHDLAIIVDEVFLDYGHDGVRHKTFATNEGALTFTLSGLSKISGLPQMKVAWVVTSGPAKEVATAMGRMEIIADTYLSMNAPIQLAAPMLLDQRRNIQSQLQDRVRLNLAELDRQLSGQKTCERLQLQGGWYAVLRVPAVQSDEDLAIEILRETAVLVHPGHFYDFASDGYLVLSLITPLEEFREGMERVLRFLNS